VASAGLYANLHLAPDRQPRQHSNAHFYRTAHLPAAQQTASKHWRHFLQTHRVQIHTACEIMLQCSCMGDRKGMGCVKNWVGVVGCWRSCVSRHNHGADLHMAQCMPLPLTISCCSKSILILPSWKIDLSSAGLPGWSQTKSNMVVKCVRACVK